MLQVLIANRGPIATVHDAQCEAYLRFVPEVADMIALITDKQSAIAALCREFGIRKLEVFGSATTDRFDASSSDVDFIVDLGGYEQGVARRFMRFARALEGLLGRNVELITEEQIRNPYFREAVNEQRVTIHEAGDSQAAA